MEMKTGNSSAVQHGRVPRKTESFLQIQLLPSWYLGSARPPTERTEIRGDIRACHWSYAEGGWDYGTVEIQRRLGGLCVQSYQSLQNIFLECCHHPSVGQQNSTVSYPECYRRSRTGNKNLLFSRKVARMHPSLLLPVCFLAWSQTGGIYKVNVAKSKFAWSICPKLYSSSHQAQLSQRLKV